MSLQSLAPELLARIAVCSVADDDPLGPPSSILPLLLTNRRINSAISLNRNFYLQAQIFRLKFDHAAPARRLSPRWTTSRCLASELRKRCETLKRLRAGDNHGPHLLSDLWTAFIMMLENDGMNEKQLLDWARFPVFLRNLVRFDWGSSAYQHPDTTYLPLIVWLIWLTSNADELKRESPEDKKVIMTFLRQFVVDGHLYSSYLAPNTYFDIPLANQPPIPSPASSHHISGQPRNTTPLPALSYITHYSHSLKISYPIITSAAFLALSARLEVDCTVEPARNLLPDRQTANALGIHGPTLQDMNEYNSQSRTRLPIRHAMEASHSRQSQFSEGKTNSEHHDADWYRIVSCCDPYALAEEECPLRGPVFMPGELTGLWVGKFMVCVPLVNDPPSTPSEVLMSKRAMFLRLQEHHNFDSDFPCSGHESNDPDYLHHTWFPPGTEWIRREEDNCVEIYHPNVRKRLRYETYVPNHGKGTNYPGMEMKKLERSRARDVFPGPLKDYEQGMAKLEYIDDDDCWEDTVEHQPSGVQDIIVTGSTDPQHGDAWDHFTFIGRVRPWDGLIVLIRIPRPGEELHGRYAFTGHLTSSRNLVGRWLDNSTQPNATGLQGPWACSKVE